MVDSAALAAARVLACITVAELWLRYFALGGSNSRADLNALLRGETTFGPAQYDVLVHALNERFVELDLDYPVPYARDPR